MSDHVQSTEVFYTNQPSHKAHLCWKQSVRRAITFWAQAITVPLKGHNHRCLAKVNAVKQNLRP